jgi:predicted transposase
MDRTIKLKLNTTPEQDASLLASMSGFTQAFNYLCQYGWEHNLKNNVKLQRECYYNLKLLMPEIQELKEGEIAPDFTMPEEVGNLVSLLQLIENSKIGS